MSICLSAVDQTTLPHMTLLDRSLTTGLIATVRLSVWFAEGNRSSQYGLQESSSVGQWVLMEPLQY